MNLYDLMNEDWIEVWFENRPIPEEKIKLITEEEQDWLNRIQTEPMRISTNEASQYYVDMKVFLEHWLIKEDYVHIKPCDSESAKEIINYLTKK